MCGITGYVGLTPESRPNTEMLQAAVHQLNKRGPDNQATFVDHRIGLGHARLSIFDTSERGNQPFFDPSGRYCIIFNGEFYNWKEHREQLESKGMVFRSDTDTEVLLQLYIMEGPDCLHKINGFFALAIYDKEANTVFIARDRIGIKPLYYYTDASRLIFASEMKAMLAWDIPREIDSTALFGFLQLNYLNGSSIFKNVQQLNPGQWAYITNLGGQAQVELKQWYRLPYQAAQYAYSSEAEYGQAQKQLEQLLNESVELRLAADVPVGTFLSGGIDSSVITALATRHSNDVHTFSIGFSDNPYFDETEYAQAVAKQYGTEHTVFSLKQEDLFEHLDSVLDYIDEPFADSSALNVYILSRETRKHVTVALSGDGADELFSGYNKHMADFRARHPGAKEKAVGALAGVWGNLPKSRNSKLGNKVRQFDRFASGMKLSPAERYWRWASILDEHKAAELMQLNWMHETANSTAFHTNWQQKKSELLQHITAKGDINEVLYTDAHMVLQGDMLTKVDRMSMANSLEVRTPFLDHRVAEFAFSIPPDYKIIGGMKKRILQDTFRDALPEMLYKRPKQGFEVPLLDWFRTGLRSRIEDDLLKKSFVTEQGIFDVATIESLKKQLFSADPGDAAATVWALIVFQTWWKRYLAS